MVRFQDIIEIKIRKHIELEEGQIDTKALQGALEISKSSVAKAMEVPCLTGYYIGTDKIRIIKINR